MRSIKHFEMDFDPENASGWHVLIGDNGSGKTSIIRAVSLALVGPKEAAGLIFWENWNTWPKEGSQNGEIRLSIKNNIIYDRHTGTRPPLTKKKITNKISFEKEQNGIGAGVILTSNLLKGTDSVKPGHYNWGTGKGWFSAAFGPFRRFTGG